MAASTHTTMIRPAPYLSTSTPEGGSPTPINSCASAMARPNGSRPMVQRTGHGRQIEAIDWSRPIDTPTMIPTTRISAHNGRLDFGSEVDMKPRDVSVLVFDADQVAGGRLITRQVSEPCAMSVPAASQMRPSAVAMRLPVWMTLPSQRNLPVLLGTARTKLMLISTVV